MIELSSEFNKDKENKNEENKSNTEQIKTNLSLDFFFIIIPP